MHIEGNRVYHSHKREVSRMIVAATLAVLGIAVLVILGKGQSSSSQFEQIIQQNNMQTPHAIQLDTRLNTWIDPNSTQQPGNVKQFFPFHKLSEK